MAETPKARRQAELQTRFLGGAKLTYEQIAERYGVSLRTAKRDVIDLRDMGLVLEPEELDTGLRIWSVPPGSRVIKVRYSFLDVMSLFLGRRFFDFLENTVLEDSFNRVYGRIEEPLEQAKDVADARRLYQKVYLVHEGPKKLTTRSLAAMDDCLSALLTEKKLAIRYRKGSGELKKYLVHPYSLVAYKRGLYLVAYSEEKNKPRVFNLERITSATWLRKESFVYPRSFDPARFFEDAMFIVLGNPEPVELRFTASTEPFIKIRRFHKTQKLSKRADGSLKMTLKVPVDFELVNWLLGFGPHVEVIRPPSLRQKVQEALSKALEQYET